MSASQQPALRPPRLPAGTADRPGRPVRIRLAPALAAALVLLTGLGVGPARAERADREKPTQIEADAMHYDDVRQTNVFAGKVTLTKGTLVIRADRIVMRQDAEGYQYAVATGDPATFRQKRDGGELYVQGRAQQLEYDGKAETIRFLERAHLKRLEGERVTDEVHGSVIVYDGRREVFTVDGGGGRAATPENPGGRVRVIIQPKAEPRAATPAPAPAPVPLRPATGTSARP
jgi:lipopolysaccharide export system protein LptA